MSIYINKYFFPMQPAEVLGLVDIPAHIRFWGIDSGIRHRYGIWNMSLWHVLLILFLFLSVRVKPWFMITKEWLFIWWSSGRVNNHLVFVFLLQCWWCRLWVCQSWCFYGQKDIKVSSIWTVVWLSFTKWPKIWY